MLTELCKIIACPTTFECLLKLFLSFGSHSGYLLRPKQPQTSDEFAYNLTVGSENARMLFFYKILFHKLAS